MTVPIVNIIIPTCNRKASLLRTLESLSRQTYPAERFEVIIVDDGGTDGTECITEQNFPFALRYLRQENQGEIVARNYGVEQSAGEILIFLDDDIEVNPPYIETIIAVHKQYPRAVVLGELVEIAWLPSDVSRSKTLEQKALEPEALTFVDCMSGIVSLTRSGFFEIGAMQPLLVGEGRNIWGGIDLGYRAHRREFSFWRAKGAIAIHHDEAAVSLATRCRRGYRVSKAVHHLFAKYPELKGLIPMFRDKGPVVWKEDSLGLILRKLARQIASSRPVMWGMESVVPLLERRAPKSTALRLLYRWIVSGYIYRGYREGLMTLAH